MVLKLREKRLINELGKPAEIHQGLVEYRENVCFLASKRIELTQLHPDKWVAAYRGEVASIAENLDKLLRDIDRRGLPRDGVAIQFLDTQRRVMVL